MKTSLLICVILLANLSFSQSFNTSTPISLDPIYGNFHPQIEMSGDGFPVVLWTSSDSLDVYFAKHDGVSGFNTPLKLNPDGLDVQDFNWSGADLSVDGDNIYVVFREQGYSTGGVYMVKSTDNGVSFGDTLRIDNLPVGFGQYPDIAAANDTVWVTFMDHDAAGLNPEYVVTRSTDGGATFTTAVTAGSLWPGEACDCCQPEIIVDDSRVIVFFRNNNSNIREIKAVVSTDRGGTFTDSYSVDDHNWMINSCPSTGPDARFMGPNKTLTAYKTVDFGAATVYVNEWNLTTGSSDALVAMSSPTGANNQINYPQLAYEEAENMIGVVWEAAAMATDVFINASSTGVAGLLAANSFNITNISGTQSKPDVIIKDGIFHVVYMDYNDKDVKYVQLTSNFANIQPETLSPLGVKSYPTPAKEKVILEFDNTNNEEVTFQLFNLNGQEVISKLELDPNVITIKRGELEAGVYMYSLKVGNQVAKGQIQFVD